MRFVPLHNLLNSVNIRPPKNFINPGINNISFNSKEVSKGTLFLGLPGLNIDGGTFWKEAIENGAEAAIISEDAKKITGKDISNKILVLKKPLDVIFGQIISEFWNRPSRKLKLIGVTGTNGKTTITYILEHLCNKLEKKAALFGTLFNRWPGYSEVSSHTTDFADKLQYKLNAALEASAEFAILEVSSHAIAQRRIAGCEFNGVIFTNLSQDHLDYHGDMESYFKTKLALFKSPYLVEKKGFSVINVDDKWGDKLSNNLVGKTLLFSNNQGNKYSRKDNFFYITNKKITENGSYCCLHTPSEEIQLFIPLVGEFNLTNAIQAMIILYEFGFALKDLSHAIKSFEGVPGRMEKIRIDQKDSKSILPQVIVDYAHTPDGLEKVLQSISYFSKGQIIVVFGCGGDRDSKKRPLMGSIAEELSDITIITSDNPRKEDPQEIIDDILKGVKNRDKIIINIDRFKAISKAINIATANDTILIAGKGHEDYQILNNEIIYFDDRKIAKDLLTKKLEFLV